MKRTDGPWSVYELIPGVLYQRGKLHALDPEKKQAGLEFYGITRSAALAPTKPDLDLVGWDMLGLHHYHHQPIPDGLLKVDLLPLAASLAHYIEEGNGAVLTMCNAGRNRSGLLSALIIRELYGLPGAAAAEIVRTHRPNALANEHFMRYLEGLE